MESLIILAIHFTSLLILVNSIQPPFACAPSNPSIELYPFCNTTLPINERVQDLISRLTLDEKISQLDNAGPAIPRLGIPNYNWWSEALHGISFYDSSLYAFQFEGKIETVTSFPQVILTAATFDAHLWYRIGRAIATEARAMYNAGQATGMGFWEPNINIFRDPRWGRGQETPGEDPLLTAKYAISFVRGLQGDSFEGGKLCEHLQASACCKSFTAYDLDSWKGVKRYVYDARVTAQDLADTFQPPFQSCIQEGKASGIMCAFNRVNGVPACADYSLLTKTAREEWGFNGYITSDCDAVANMYELVGYAKSPEDAVADALKAGVDVNCGDYLRTHAKSAVNQGKLLETQIDRALHNLFSVRMRLGLFNGDPTEQPYGDIGPEHVCSKEHRDLALDVARDGIVLLKNTAKLLPFSKSETRSLAVIGPNADSPESLLGDYPGIPCRTVTPLKALKTYVNETVYHPGCSKVECYSAATDEAVDIASKMDHAVLVMGLDQTQEREAFDRINLVLPGMQQELITRIAEAAKQPIVLVLLSGGPVDISFAKNDPNIGSILWAGYPGEAGGTALAEIIFGDHNPGGRLPVTWYPQSFTRIPMTDMRMRAQPSTGYPGRTYRFYEGKRVFEFGYGLSYTNYIYEFISVGQNKLFLDQLSSKQKVKGYRSVSEIGKELCEKKKFRVTIGVINQGEIAGKHPVLLFVRHAKVGNGRPIKQMVGFQSVKLNAGERAEIAFELSPCEHLSRANEDGLMVIEEGTYFLTVDGLEYPIYYPSLTLMNNPPKS